MAFLGSLGKALGLDSEFGKGLIAGTARGFDEGFKEYIQHFDIKAKEYRNWVDWIGNVLPTARSRQR